MKKEPKITVGIMERQAEISVRFDGHFHANEVGPLTGKFLAKAGSEKIILSDENSREICQSPLIRFTAHKETPLGLRQETKSHPGQAFTLFNVTIGNRFHWERKEDLTFRGDLILRLARDETIVAINEILLEDYLASVISSEMNGDAPIEFLKAHSILSRSWLLAGLERRKKRETILPLTGNIQDKKDEVLRWYDREDHEHFDVCSDDHCQRYQGITKIISNQAEEAVRTTHGRAITFQDEICDARYSKACGGITEKFDTAWEDRQVPYLESISDASIPHPTIKNEEEAAVWVLSEPEAYCNTHDQGLLEKILPDLDRETKSFFRWKVEYSRKELSEILRGKSGFDFGTIQDIVVLGRGPSGRIFRLKIVGSKRSMVVGKELEIRRWLSRTHLYSSAFVVRVEPDRFIFHGSGWGHGVGLCQIGAAVMASQGFSAEEILNHYFRGTEIKTIY
jgi:SpoIID/LytB domain protein